MSVAGWQRPAGGGRLVWKENAMRRSTAFVVIAVAAMTTVTTSAAFAAKGGVPGPPDPGDPGVTTTTVESALWTCEARNEAGATWVLGEWDGVSYAAGGPGTCIDIDEPGHTAAHRWLVTWSGETAKGTDTVKGLLLRYETEVHGTVWAEEVFTTTGGSWSTAVIDPPDEAFVFVAMPHSGDRWTAFQVTVTPLPADVP
jgi:hypothetical protein